MALLRRTTGQDAPRMLAGSIVGLLVASVLTWGWLGGESGIQLSEVYAPIQARPSNASFWIAPGVWILSGALFGVLIGRLQLRGCLVTLAVAVSFAVLYSLPMAAAFRAHGHTSLIVTPYCLIPISGLTFAILWVSQTTAVRWNLDRTIALAPPLILAFLATAFSTWLINRIFSSIPIGEASAASTAYSIARERDLDISRIEVETLYDYLAQVDLGANIPSEYEVSVHLANGDILTCKFEWVEVASSDDCG